MRTRTNPAFEQEWSSDALHLRRDLISPVAFSGEGCGGAGGRVEDVTFRHLLQPTWVDDDEEEPSLPAEALSLLEWRAALNCSRRRRSQVFSILEQATVVPEDVEATANNRWLRPAGRLAWRILQCWCRQCPLRQRPAMIAKSPPPLSTSNSASSASSTSSKVLGRRMTANRSMSELKRGHPVFQFFLWRSAFRLPLPTSKRTVLVDKSPWSCQCCPWRRIPLRCITRTAGALTVEGFSQFAERRFLLVPGWSTALCIPAQATA